MGVPLTHRSSNFPLKDQTCRRHSPSSNQSSILVWNPLLLKSLLNCFYQKPKDLFGTTTESSFSSQTFSMNESVLLSADEQTLRIKKSMDTKTEWYMTKFRLLKHRGCNLIGHRLSCKNSCHRSLDTRRQCDLPSKSMYHCRLSQTLMRKI